VFGKHPGGFQGRRVDVHHRELLVDLRCLHDDPGLATSPAHGARWHRSR
jgi:hypothetical protein